jgi:hydrogenase 3 maturation protease
VGHELRGDDAAGLLVARGLLNHLPEDYEDIAPALHPALLVIEAGAAPENVTGRLRRYQPDLVILVDAADLHVHPGTVRWLDWRETEGLSASTHTLPLNLVGQYLAHELNCQVALLGIQPASNDIGHEPSLLVQLAIDSLVIDLIALLWLKAARA